MLGRSRRSSVSLPARGQRVRGQGSARRASRPSNEHWTARALSEREHQVALAAAEGSTNKEIAAELFLSPRTVELHLASAYRKLGVRRRSELAPLVSGPGVPKNT